MMMYPPWFPLLVSSLIHHTMRASSGAYLLAGDVSLALILWSLPPTSVLSIWRWVIMIARRWTNVPGITSIVPAIVIRGGPLGPGCGKVVEIVTGCLLWKRAYPAEPLPLQLGPFPSLLTWIIVLALSGVTNFVLLIWSQSTKSRGDHSGVHNMVETSRGRSLSATERFKLLVWAILNAICEEASSRGLWMQEFQRRGQVSVLHANVLQALSFGVWHFHGIPSGWTGVALTFVYGLGMGFMKEYGGGLLLPIVAHSIADYFIFAVIARKGGFR